LGRFLELGGGEWTVNDWRYLCGLGLTVGLLMFGNLFPWPRELRLLERYVWGVGSILAGYAVWLGLTLMFWKLAAFAVIGGVFVGLLYWYKRDRNQTIRLQGQSDAPAPDDD
jgi:membrane associated rhomboid family serine protease